MEGKTDRKIHELPRINPPWTMRRPGISLVPNRQPRRYETQPSEQMDLQPFGDHSWTLIMGVMRVGLVGPHRERRTQGTLIYRLTTECLTICVLR